MWQHPSIHLHTHDHACELLDAGDLEDVDTRKRVAHGGLRACLAMAESQPRAPWLRKLQSALPPLPVPPPTAGVSREHIKSSPLTSQCALPGEGRGVGEGTRA